MIAGTQQPQAALLSALKARYAEPHRTYHTWRHIEALIALLRDHQALSNNPTAVLWAILWHDAVYDPHRTDNEHRSAELLLSDGASDLAADDLNLAVSLVRATAHHLPPQELAGRALDDCKLFLDLDLSILAAPEVAFDLYERQIREEYSFVARRSFAPLAPAFWRRSCRDRRSISPHRLHARGSSRRERISNARSLD